MSLLKPFLENLIRILENKDSKPPSTTRLDTNRTVNPKKDPQDKVTPNLYKGKILEDSSIKCEVVDVHHNNIHVKILDIYWPRMETYLNVGQVYPVFQHSGWDKTKIQVWEISPKHMMRDTSQVILQWEEGLGWTWDLDF